MDDVAVLLKKRGVQPSAQRVAVAKYALATHDHPSADEVWERVRRTLPSISRATVYNTLNLFADKGLMSRHVIAEGRVVFDSVVEPHHHFIDEATGRIHDVPLDAIRVSGVDGLAGFDVRAHQVVMRGRRRSRAKGR
jgi:Fur family transcriptional regulator, iron response regulator